MLSSEGSRAMLRPLLWVLSGESGVLEKQVAPQKKDLGIKLWGTEKTVTLKLLPFKQQNYPRGDLHRMSVRRIREK